MNLPHSGGVDAVSGTIRIQPQDFYVDETLGFEPAGAGEHFLVRIEKTGANTAWVAARLAEFCRVAKRDVSYAGRKDRHAVTRQWFSVWLPGQDDPSMDQLQIDGVRVIETVRHNRKLRRGALAWNEFRILVRELSDPSGVLEGRLQQLQRLGFPNFFGPQRFGHDGANLAMARRWFAGARLKRNERSMALSAARGQIFNAVLEQRIANGTWNQPVPGDALMLDGSASYFVCDRPDGEIGQRIASGDLHVSGPLWGDGQPPVEGAAAELETAVATQYGDLVAGLERNRLKQERRPLRVMARNLSWELGEGLLLSCHLPAGVFATSLLGSIMTVRDAARDARAK